MSDTPNDIEIVYGYLLSKFMRAGSPGGDRDLQTRIYQAIMTYEELWPEETQRWRNRFPNATADEARPAVL